MAEDHNELREMVGKLDDEKVDGAAGLLSDALGDWWKDERHKWCAYCGIPMKKRWGQGKTVPQTKATRDHVIPKKHIPKGHKGGMVTIPACHGCNQAKDTMSLPEFLLSEHFAEKRKQKHRNQWPVKDLWLVSALAAVKRSRVV